MIVFDQAVLKVDNTGLVNLKTGFGYIAQRASNSEDNEEFIRGEVYKIPNGGIICLAIRMLLVVHNQKISNPGNSVIIDMVSSTTTKCEIIFTNYEVAQMVGRAEFLLQSRSLAG